MANYRSRRGFLGILAAGAAGCTAPNQNSNPREDYLSDREQLLQEGDSIITKYLETQTEDTRSIPQGDNMAYTLNGKENIMEVTNVNPNSESATVWINDDQRYELNRQDSELMLEDVKMELIGAFNSQRRGPVAGFNFYEPGGLDQTEYTVERIGEDFVELSSGSEEGNIETFFPSQGITGETGLTEEYEVVFARDGEMVVDDVSNFRIETVEEGEFARDTGHIHNVNSSSVEIGSPNISNLYIPGEEFRCNQMEDGAWDKRYVASLSEDKADIAVIEDTRC